MADRSMRVVFDGHALTPHRSGIGVYSASLLEALLADFADEVELHLYVPGRVLRVRSMDDVAHASAGIPDGALYSPRHQWELPRLLAAGSCDVFHAPDFLLPFLLRGTAIVATIHDLIPIVMRHHLRHSLKVRLLPLYRLALRMAALRARRIITVSEHSREDIVRLLGVSAGRIDVTPVASALPVLANRLLPPFDAQLVPQEYFLYVGRHDKYKGIGLMLEAFRDACAREGWTDMRVVITGQEDARYPVGETIRAFGLEGRVLLTGYIDDAQLSSLYANALALVFPTLYEGFGLPVLDAMRHDTPVICSNRASVPEVAGDAAIVVDPEDRSALTDALVEIRRNATLRASLIARGTERARRYSWGITAAATVESYRKALQRP